MQMMMMMMMMMMMILIIDGDVHDDAVAASDTA